LAGLSVFGRAARNQYQAVPPAIKQAILLLVGHWFANRETVVIGTIVAQMPSAVEALLSTYRV
jgi:uncharacterized phiE125 gp8 family phage protein